MARVLALGGLRVAAGQTAQEHLAGLHIAALAGVLSQLEQLVGPDLIRASPMGIAAGHEAERSSCKNSRD